MTESVKYGNQFIKYAADESATFNALAAVEGKTLFADSTSTTSVKATADFVSTRLVIADDDASVTAQKSATEDFATIFSQWQRVAIVGLNPNATPAEFDNWSFSGDNSIIGALNTASTVGFISPRSVADAYTFEVNLSSTNADDDFIGIFLGYVEVDGVCNTLSLVRSAGGNAGRPLFGLYLNFQGYNSNTTNTQEVMLVGGNFGLKSPDGVVYTANQQGSPLGGWQAYTTNGGVKIKATMTSDGKLTCVSNNPGEAYVATSQFTFDLASRADTQQFIGGTRIGYMAMSQPSCTWASLTRPGSREDFIDSRTFEIWSWSGTAWTALDSSKLDDYVRVGRHYYNEVNGKMFYYNPDTLTLDYVCGVANDFATDQQVIDGLATNLNISPAGLRALWNHLHP